MEVPKGLKRYPHRARELLQAWDSADELILRHLSTLGPPEESIAGKRILIANDAFGALSCALKQQGLVPTVYTDSYLSSQAIGLNCPSPVKLIHELTDLGGTYDYVLIKIPKNMAFFEDLLCHLSGHLHAGSKLISGYMIKHQSKTSFELLEKIIGKTSTSLAHKKARLIFADFEKTPMPSPYPIRLEVESFEKPFINHSNLFSHAKLDIGTRFLLEHIPEGDYPTILDLGCASGIIGIAAKRLNPASKIIFTDESRMAIMSAEANYGNYFRDEALFQWTHSCENQPAESVDLVICNPPFHQGNTVGDFTAWQMFQDAHRVLKRGGKLRIIGNSHLQYQHSLKKIFGNFEPIAKNSKFSIFGSEK